MGIKPSLLAEILKIQLLLVKLHGSALSHSVSLSESLTAHFFEALTWEMLSQLSLIYTFLTKSNWYMVLSDIEYNHLTHAA